MTTSTVVIGIGNDFRGDDAAGRLAARRLAEHGPGDAIIHESTGEALSLIELWGGADRVILIDAAAGLPPGDVQRYDARAEALPAGRFSTSSHAFSLAEAIDLARTLDQLPPGIVVYAIGGAAFDLGAELSPEAERGCEEAIARILEELAPHPPQSPVTP